MAQSQDVTLQHCACQHSMHLMHPTTPQHSSAMHLALLARPVLPSTAAAHSRSILKQRGQKHPSGSQQNFGIAEAFACAPPQSRVQGNQTDFTHIQGLSLYTRAGNSGTALTVDLSGRSSCGLM